MKKFDPNVARDHHEVTRSMQVDVEVINRAIKVQLAYVDLMKPGGQRVLST